MSTLGRAIIQHVGQHLSGHPLTTSQRYQVARAVYHKLLGSGLKADQQPEVYQLHRLPLNALATVATHGVNIIDDFSLVSEGKRVKCIVVDADNTLWAGVVGEDGLADIQVTPQHAAFQQKLKALKEKGFMLAICSKNDQAAIDQVLEKHPDMRLRKSDFVAIKANWIAKATNLEAIAQELNIGTDSLLFLDDTAHERAMVRTLLPQVMVPEFTVAAHSRLIAYEATRFLELMEIFIGNRPVTAEDRSRTDYVRVRDETRAALASAASIEDAYRQLQMKLLIREGDANLPYIERLAQLSQRTNQFNFTYGHRLTERVITLMIGSADYRVFSLELSNRFGPFGIVGLIVVKLKDKNIYGTIISPTITAYCLSCRVLGLTVEKAFLGYVMDMLKGEKRQELRVDYNHHPDQPMSDFFATNSFKMSNRINDGSFWPPVPFSFTQGIINTAAVSLTLPDWLEIRKESEPPFTYRPAQSPQAFDTTQTREAIANFVRANPPLRDGTTCRHLDEYESQEITNEIVILHVSDGGMTGSYDGITGELVALHDIYYYRADTLISLGVKWSRDLLWEAISPFAEQLPYHSQETY